jgi:hypothetical protein
MGRNLPWRRPVLLPGIEGPLMPTIAKRSSSPHANATSFQPGNTQSMVTHGVGSPRLVAAKVEQIRGPLDRTYRPLLVHDPRDAAIFEDWVWVSAQLEMIQDFLNRTSSGALIDRRGRERKCAGLAMKLRSYKMALQRELIMSPLARSQSVGDALKTEGLAAQLARRQLQRAKVDVGAERAE